MHGPDENDQPKALTGRGCRCTPCIEDNRRYARLLEAKKRAGISSFVTPEEAKEARIHVELLLAAGMGTRQISAVSGVSRSAITELLAGQDRVQPHIALALLSLDVPTLADGALVDATATWQKINTLRAAGYTKTWLAGQITGGRSLQLGADQVTVRNAARVDHVFQQWLGVPPTLHVTACCWQRGQEHCQWTGVSTWFCTSCGYARHACPPP